MPDRDKNPLIEAFLEVSRRGQYSKVMEGIGHVAVAVSYAEFVVDGLGWALTGEFEVYMALTKSMPLRQKIERVRDMCKSLITDTDLRNNVNMFCTNLIGFISRRNDAVHSLYGLDRGAVIRINLRAAPQQRRTAVTSAELLDLSLEITKLASAGASLQSQVEEHRRKPPP